MTDTPEDTEADYLTLNALMIISAILQIACQSRRRVTEKDRFRVDGIGTFTVGEALDMADRGIGKAQKEAA